MTRGGDSAYELEEIVDAEGLERVIEMLSTICFEKADHVRTNWQDERLAKLWEKAGKALDKVKLPELP